MSSPILCRLIGHRWTPSLVLAACGLKNLSGWVYLEDICRRCSKTEYRLSEWAEARDEFNRSRRRQPSDSGAAP